MRVLIASVAAILLLPSDVLAGDASLLVANASSQSIQNARADTENLTRMRDVAMIRRFRRTGYLVTVPSTTRFYYLQAIPPAYRYCRPWTKLFLDRLSRQYYARFKQPLRVTSLVRTVAQQRRLARRNGNAADATGSQRSSHLAGATLDISKRFMTPQGESWMRNVLYTLKLRGHLYAVEEFEQPTFHIMIYRNYTEHVAQLNQAARNGELEAAPGLHPVWGAKTTTRTEPACPILSAKRFELRSTM
jgi:Family of unknown function (DUF5715)